MNKGVLSALVVILSIYQPLSYRFSNLYLTHTFIVDNLPKLTSGTLVNLGIFTNGYYIGNISPALNTDMEDLSIFDINKKNDNGEYLWTFDDIWKYNEEKRKGGKTKQVIVRCGYYNDGKCIHRGLITMGNLSRHTLDVHCGGDVAVFESNHKYNLVHYKMINNKLFRRKEWKKYSHKTRKRKRSIDVLNEIKQQNLKRLKENSPAKDATDTPCNNTLDAIPENTCQEPPQIINVAANSVLSMKGKDGKECIVDASQIQEMMMDQKRYKAMLKRKKPRKNCSVHSLNMDYNKHGLFVVYDEDRKVNMECRHCWKNVSMQYMDIFVNKEKHCLRNAILRHLKSDDHYFAMHGQDKWGLCKKIWMNLSRECVEMILDYGGYVSWTRRVEKLYRLGLPVGNWYHSKRGPEHFVQVLFEIVK